ncbi:MAG: histidine acid phosphatase [Prevotellaceae bacterium]|nr:histidine acid phosphatase [Prevotellaceae bacterium]MDY3856350.1 histidine acid phosphatase [Bacteroidaceae bacterium]
MRFLQLICMLFCLVPVSAQTTREQIYANPNLGGANHCIYPEPNGIIYTPAPKGYKPVYLSTFARHGSRMHWRSYGYSRPKQILDLADSLGKLTIAGHEVRIIVDSLADRAKDRLGELTPLGARQHRGIAKRMYRNFPSLFRGKVHIEAHSTPVMRCILSMMNQLYELQGLAPQLDIHSDASYADKWYLASSESKYNKYSGSQQLLKSREAWRKAHSHPEGLIKRLFSDTVYANQHVNKAEFELLLFELANLCYNMEAPFDLMKYFTREEVYDNYAIDTYNNYLIMGNSPLNHGYPPYQGAHLLRNFIETADTCLASGRKQVTLRFGHDTGMGPFIALMRLGHAGLSTSKPQEVIEKWRTYEIFPMAANVQMIFYRKAGKPDLVKIMLQEREMTLPIQTRHAPYYRWDEVRAYFLKILADNPTLI